MTEQELTIVKEFYQDYDGIHERAIHTLIAEVERLKVCEIFSDIDRRLSEENLELQAEVERLKAENAKLLEQALNGKRHDGDRE